MSKYMNPDVLSEVYGVVNAMGVKYKEKIPEDMWAAISEKRNKDYVPFIDAHKRLREQDITFETVTFIAMLHRDYWCETDEERARLEAVFEKNEREYNEKIASEKSARKRLKLLKYKREYESD